MSDSNPLPPAMRFALGLFLRALDDFAKLSPADQADYMQACSLGDHEAREAFRTMGAYLTKAAAIAEVNRTDQQRQPGALQ